MWCPSIWAERKWRQREEMRGKNSVTRVRNGVFALNKIKNGPIRALKRRNTAKNSVVVPKTSFLFLKFCFQDIIILNGGQGGRPTNFATLHTICASIGYQQRLLVNSPLELASSGWSKSTADMKPTDLVVTNSTLLSSLAMVVSFD